MKRALMTVLFGSIALGLGGCDGLLSGSGDNLTPLAWVQDPDRPDCVCHNKRDICKCSSSDLGVPVPDAGESPVPTTDPGASLETVTVSLAWDANSEPNLAGYNFYYSDAPGPPFTGSFIAGQGPSPVEIPLSMLPAQDTPAFTLTGIPAGKHLYFAVTAYSTTNEESGFSNFVDRQL